MEEGQPTTFKSEKEAPTIPLNLSADNGDEKKSKRAVEMDHSEMDRIKRVKMEQTEATDLSMKNTSSASQNKTASLQVIIQPRPASY